MNADDLAAAVSDLAGAIDDCVHGADYLAPEIDQLIEAFRKLTNHVLLLTKYADYVNAQPEDARQQAGDAVNLARSALLTAQGKDARRRAISLTFEAGPLVKAVLPANLLA